MLNIAKGFFLSFFFFFCNRLTLCETIFLIAIIFFDLLNQIKHCSCVVVVVVVVS